MTAPTAPAAAAFVRVEQTLLPSAAVGASLRLAAEAPGVGRRLGRLAALAGSLPALGALGLADRRLQSRAGALHLRGLSEDRIAELAPEAYAPLLDRPLRPGGLALLERVRLHAQRLFLISDGLELALRPLAERLGAEALCGARLELRDGVATGRLEGPALRESVAAAKAFAAERGIALAGSYAYGSDLADAPLLEAVGFPCAVNPDWRLRRLAAARGWPILDVAGVPA